MIRLVRDRAAVLSTTGRKGRDCPFPDTYRRKSIELYLTGLFFRRK